MRGHFIFFCATTVAIVACGARSSLEEPAPSEIPVQAGDQPDAGPDVNEVADAAPDVETPVMDVVDCADAGITYIYLITQERLLYRYRPPGHDMEEVGTIDCNSGGEPYSMAVDRAGIAYVLFSDGNVFRVSPATLSCTPTRFIPQLGNFAKFGMGFSANASTPGEELFLASESTPEEIATVDLQSFKPSTVGALDRDVGSLELTGTGDGKLYGFGVGLPKVHLAQIDKRTARVLDDTAFSLPSGNMPSSWAFAYYGGDFYIFAAQGGVSHVSRYRPADRPATATELFRVNNTIVGAGVSTCAPQQ